MTHYVLSGKSLVPVSGFWISLASKTWHYSVQIICLVRKAPGGDDLQSQQEDFSLSLQRKHTTASYCSNRLYLVSHGFSSRFVSLFNNEILGLWHRVPWGISCPSLKFIHRVWKLVRCITGPWHNHAQSRRLAEPPPPTQKVQINTNPISSS